MSKWTEGQRVVIVDDTDDPQWPERFPEMRAVIVDPMGKHSRWVLVQVGDPFRAIIRFPKSSLRDTDEYDAQALEERWEKMDRGGPVPVVPNFLKED